MRLGWKPGDLARPWFVRGTKKILWSHPAGSHVGSDARGQFTMSDTCVVIAVHVIENSISAGNDAEYLCVLTNKGQVGWHDADDFSCVLDSDDISSMGNSK